MEVFYYAVIVGKKKLFYQFFVDKVLEENNRPARIGLPRPDFGPVRYAERPDQPQTIQCYGR